MGFKDGESNEMNRFLNEIMEQPAATEATLNFYLSPEGEKKLENFRKLIGYGQISRLIFTGMGSSYFVSYAASSLFNKLGIYSNAINTRELLHYQLPILDSRTALVCVSQSGESFEIVKLLEKIPESVLCIGVCNEESSSLTKSAREVLITRAGREERTSTKTYLATTLVLFILGWYLADLWNPERKEMVRKLIAGINDIVGRRSALALDILGFLGEVEFVQFIGRGPSYSTALQSELMFKEGARVAAAGALGGEFRHGPMEMVKPGFKSILFAAEGKTYSQSVKMAKDIAKYHGKVVIITNKDNHGISDSKILPVVIDQPDEYLFSIQSIVPVQLLVNDLALSKGYEPGQFVHGGKVTLSE